MQCEEVAEYVSAICDGQTISPEAAEHLGQCDCCRSRLSEYVEIGVELRRLASMESTGKLRINHWEQIPRTSTGWWKKGGETVRIPRFAVALLLAVVFVLASGLVIGSVRAHTRGRVLMLMAKPAEGHTLPCTLVAGGNDYCRTVQNEGISGGRGVYTFRILADDGEHIELGVRSARIYTQRAISTEEINELPETAYSVSPGQTLHVGVQGAGTMEIDTKLWDRFPSPGEVWDYAQSIANCGQQ